MMGSRGKYILNLALQKEKSAFSSCEDINYTNKNSRVWSNQILQDNNTNQNTEALDNLDIDINNIPIEIATNDTEIAQEIEIILEWDNIIPTGGEQSNSNLKETNDIDLPYEDNEREVQTDNIDSDSSERNNNSDTDYIPNSETESEADDLNNEADQEESNNNQDNMNANGNTDFGDMNEGRKRRKTADKSQWKRIKNQQSRMKGEEYLGFSRNKNKTFIHNVPRVARIIGERCSSKMCLSSKKRFCSSITEEVRSGIFTKFWQNMTWDQRKVYVSGHVSLQNEKRKSRNYRINRFKEDKAFLNKFFNDLPKQPSHYVRKDTNKLYLVQHFMTLKQLHAFYKEVCEENHKQCLGIKTFKESFYEKNLSLFFPKKDRCDLCIEYEMKNIEEDIWKKHIDDKDSARKEQSNDKARALQNKCIMLCMDLQAVKVAPSLNATKIYFKTKLGCHNFTIYNCASHQATCYWFTKVDCGLSASTFISCLIDYLERHCLGKNLPIIIYSDGCTFQNRNNIRANALLNFSNMHSISITQKYLTKGHTQMECDSVHSCIERKLKNRVIELPSDYIKASKEARRHPDPYEVIQLNYDFFKDFSSCECLRYSTIKPNRDALVTHIKAINYDPKSYIIKVKLDFNEEFKELPSRSKIVAPILSYPKLYKRPLPITQKKWNHLQDLKTVISKDCHSFYDLLPHAQERSTVENYNSETDTAERPAKKAKPKK